MGAEKGLAAITTLSRLEVADGVLSEKQLSVLKQLMPPWCKVRSVK
jgi:hypothetical protein